MSYINLDYFYGCNLLEVFLFSHFRIDFKVNPIKPIDEMASLPVLDGENIQYCYF